MLEFIHALVETLDKYFENVCELDIMFNLEKAHFILGEQIYAAVAVPDGERRSCFNATAAKPPRRVSADEMVTNGCVVETNKANILKPILLLEKVSK
jgi:AP-4 complex subunit sigma-1